MTTHIPIGVRDFTPDEWQQQHRLQTRIFDIFKHAGYQPVSTPLLEYETTLARALPNTFHKKAIRFINNDHVMVLRPDHTVPIARLVGTHMKNTPLPLKLCYSGPIYHQQTHASHTSSEQFQMGIELIGGTDATQNDQAVLRLLQTVLHALGLTDTFIDIGHVQFANQSKQKQALLNADYIELGHIPKRGGPELAEHCPELAAVMAGLSDIASLYVNHGLVKDLAYYSGIIFEAASPQWGQPIATGGRYDRLLSQFGPDRIAVGFCLDLHALQAIGALP